MFFEIKSPYIKILFVSGMDHSDFFEAALFEIFQTVFPRFAVVRSQHAEPGDFGICFSCTGNENRDVQFAEYLQFRFISSVSAAGKQNPRILIVFQLSNRSGYRTVPQKNQIRFVNFNTQFITALEKIGQQIVDGNGVICYPGTHDQEFTLSVMTL